MPSISKSDIPNAVAAKVRREFMRMMDAPVPDDNLLNLIALTIPSDGDYEDYAWLGDLPSMEEWIGERQLKDLKEYNYSLKNKKWEVSIQVDRETVEDDRLGVILPRVKGMVDEVKRHRLWIVFRTLGLGFTQKGYDGVYFFSASHPTNTSADVSSTFSNLGSLPMTYDNVQTTITYMQSQKNDRGKSLRIDPNVCVCGSNMRVTAEEIFNSEYLPYVGSNDNQMNRNPLYKKCQVVLSDDFKDACGSSGENSWVLLDTSKSVKPLVFQDRQNARFLSLGPNSDMGFMRDKFAYGVDCRDNAGYTLPQLAYGHLVDG